jgi:hypothetical protein
MELKPGFDIEGELRRIESDLQQLAVRVTKTRLNYTYQSEEPTTRTPTPNAASNASAVGDRVKVKGRSLGSGNIIGTVTAVSPERVHIQPDGTKTIILRPPSNITIIKKNDGTSGRTGSRTGAGST